MSFNRENVTWQSEDGTWNLGFLEVVWVGEDPEWDVEYGDGFDWVSTGHSSQEAAYAAWDGANPGGGWVVAYTPETAAECGRNDVRASECACNNASRSRERFSQDLRYNQFRRNW
jgi:hypothetical protein